MTEIVEPRARNSLHNLREALEQAERQIVHLVGYLTQKAEPLSGTAPVPSITPTPAPQSP